VHPKVVSSRDWWDVLEFDVTITGATHPAVGRVVEMQAEMQHKQGQYNHALPLYQRALVVAETNDGYECSI